jgi:hypothetical protein
MALPRVEGGGHLSSVDEELDWGDNESPEDVYGDIAQGLAPPK